ncbi:hypothetical protein IWW37_002818 [Coemansia sp. RSA 2050]|nr:hypothetical protein IWW37_002818 [Coemansia sp. RSA 2050]KAJ2733934.1 hypothetical protein IW152_002689 [Coemansia sp. BCRC 34962]
MAMRKLLYLCAIALWAGCQPADATRQAALSAQAPHTQPATCPGYVAGNTSQTGDGFTAELTLAGPPCALYGRDIKRLRLGVRFDTKNRLHVHIKDSDGQQFQIPHDVIALDPGHGVRNASSSLRFDHFHDDLSGFGFRVSRGDQVVFDTVGHPLIFEDQYIEVTSSLPANANIYGMGESPDFFRRNPANTIKTLWNRDSPDLLQQNVYGSHSIYMELRDGLFHGTYLHNSHGMDIALANSTIQYRVLGGTADFYFFGGPSALDVVDQYTELVGRPSRIPYWALGFHNCRYGYKSVYEVNDVIAKYAEANIPLEVAWTDIDYMDRTRDFTFDPVNFPLAEMQKQLAHLHEHGQKMVLITDPAILRDSSYDVYARGREKDVFIKNTDGSEFIGQVWPGYTVFPDWFAHNTSRWWSGELKRFFDQLPIDGMWIDMNEAASFCTGSCGTGKPAGSTPPYPWTLDPQPPHRIINSSDTLLVPLYAIHNQEAELSDLTIETTAKHANGASEYHVHNLYGYMESKATHGFLVNYRPNQRPFILSRSTFAGSGAFVSHWTGDNAATWQDLHISIASVFDFGIFGIPMVGADICGFYGNTTEELCARWIEAGAFYPFSRVHSALASTPQELYRWETVAEAGRRALRVRYALLPHFYTSYQRSVENGWPVARPLLFEFPHIPAVVDNDRQLLVGDSILVSPVLAEGATSVAAFFPAGLWYDWYDYSAIKGVSGNVTLSAPLEHVNVHVRGGKIVPTQEPAMATVDSRKSDFGLIVATDEHGAAAGELYVDDGETFDIASRWIQFSYADRALRIEQRSGQFKLSPPLSKLVLLGVTGISNAVINGSSVSAGFRAVNGSTVVTGLDIDLNAESLIAFS